MKGFVIGLFLLPALVVAVLSIRPGGLRRQLRHAVRRLKLVLALAGIYLVGSGVIRIGFGSGPVTDYGLPILALALVVAFLVLGQDPAEPAQL